MTGHEIVPRTAEYPRVLVVDDDKSMCELLQAALPTHGFRVTTCTSAAEALLALRGAGFSCVVTDLNMRGLGGLELCERIVADQPDLPVIVLTAFGSMDTAVGAIRVGAYDFITKPVDVDALGLALQRAVQHHQLREEVTRLRRAVEVTGKFDEIVGESPAMQAVYQLLERVAESDATVLVTGERGTGKELVARALHRRGRRANGPFVALDCSALPEALLESQLFGQASGDPDEARAPRTGALLQANGGTLFLDEIADLPMALQPKLLRTLQERTVRPVGGTADTRFDTRLVCATNRDLESAVAEGRFREDLYFLINVVHVELPPLRSRGSDVLLLAQKCVNQSAARANKNVTGLSPAAAERLLAYDWPGNVRELQNCMERAVALTAYDRVAVEDLPEKVRNYRRSHVIVGSDDPAELVPLDEVERRYIERVLEAVKGNKTVASRILGLDRKTLYRKLDQYGRRSA